MVENKNKQHFPVAEVNFSLGCSIILISMYISLVWGYVFTNFVLS